MMMLPFFLHLHLFLDYCAHVVVVVGSTAAVVVVGSAAAGNNNYHTHGTNVDFVAGSAAAAADNYRTKAAVAAAVNNYRILASVCYANAGKQYYRNLMLMRVVVGHSRLFRPYYYYY